MGTEKGREETQKQVGGLVPAGQGPDLALQNAVRLWADATTDAASACRADLLRSKYKIVCSFFAGLGKHPAEITPLNVKTWRDRLEERYKQATVYARVSRLSSFYEWAMRDAVLGQFIWNNPAQLARPKCPRPYQTESTKAFDDEQMSALLRVVRKKAASGDMVGKRDYAILLFFVTTGMRRNEVISLRGSDLELKRDVLVIRCKVKGGDYVGREVADPHVRRALEDYLRSCGRVEALTSGRPLWTRHDQAGPPGAPLTSHAFAKNLKRYAREAGLGKIHIHQTRHTFARMVAEETGSIVETQDALGHRNLQTTRVYISRIAVKRDRHGRAIAARLGVDIDETTE
jgi:integrase/recombinase XerC